jgi:hypothetical protein
MSSIVIFLAMIPTAPNPGFEARFHSPQGRATLLQHFDVWSEQALLLAQDLLNGSEVDSNNLVDNPHHKRYAIQRNYRESVRHEHFVITFYGSPVSNIVTTKDGDMALLEIVISLKPAEDASRYTLDRIFSVDEEGRIHQHLQGDGGKHESFNDFVSRIIQAKQRP